MWETKVKEVACLQQLKDLPPLSDFKVGLSGCAELPRALQANFSLMPMFLAALE